jgi:hypothetical protein
MKTPDATANILRSIGYFFLQRNENSFDKTRKHLKDLFITDVRYKNKILTIRLGRPGILIGKRGETIDALKKHLEASLGEGLKIKIVENNIDEFLYSFELSQMTETDMEYL